MQNKIKLFENKEIRVAWNNEKEDWYFSIIDVVSVLNESDKGKAGTYWRVLKHRLINEGSQVVTNCNKLKLEARCGW